MTEYPRDTSKMVRCIECGNTEDETGQPIVSDEKTCLIDRVPRIGTKLRDCKDFQEKDVKSLLDV